MAVVGAVQVRFEIVDATRLRGHERTRPELLHRLTEEIRRDGYVKKPLLVAEGSYVILDGHHRYWALRALGCVRIPVYLVDYASEEIQLTTWPEAAVTDVTKEEVLARAERDPFPPKTTRHIVQFPLEDHAVDLKDLR